MPFSRRLFDCFFHTRMLINNKNFISTIITTFHFRKRAINIIQRIKDRSQSYDQIRLVKNLLDWFSFSESKIYCYRCLSALRNDQETQIQIYSFAMSTIYQIKTMRKSCQKQSRGRLMIGRQILSIQIVISRFRYNYFSKKQEMKIIFTLLLLLVSVVAFRVEEYGEHSRAAGAYTSFIRGGNETEGQPAQMFLCGTQLQARRFTVVLWNCNCGRRWYSGRKRYRCNWCPNHFDNERGAVRLYFCDYKNWNNQVVREFNSGGNNGGWILPVMCPKDTYANGFATKFHWQHGADRGWLGTKLRCSTNSLSRTSFHWDRQPDVQEYIGRQGNFISSAIVKHNGMLTGIKFGFESMPVIIGVKIDYSPIVDSGTPAKVIDTVTIRNEGTEMSQQASKFSGKYEVSGLFTESTTIIGQHDIDSSITVAPPVLGAYQGLKYFDEKTSTFSIGQQVKTTISSDKSITVFIPSCTVVSIQTFIREQNSNVSFTGEVIFANRITKQPISKQAIKGVWTGTAVSETFTVIKQETIAGCRKKNLKKEEADTKDESNTKNNDKDKKSDVKEQNNKDNEKGSENKSDKANGNSRT